MQQFSEAYVQAVASAAGCSASKPPVDDDSIDLILKRRTLGTIRRSPQLDVQVKATAIDCLKSDHVAFPLEIKNYDDLRDEALAVPRILVVVLVPPNIEEWLNHTEDQLALFRCAYWLSLRGEGDVANTSTKTVHLPRSNVFSVSGVDALFGRLAAGGAP